MMPFIQSNILRLEEFGIHVPLSRVRVRVPGIYFIVEDGELVYIGMTDDSCWRRIQEHFKDETKNLDPAKCFWGVWALDPINLADLEEALISHYRPRLNKVHSPGTGRTFLRNGFLLTVEKDTNPMQGPSSVIVRHHMPSFNFEMSVRRNEGTGCHTQGFIVEFDNDSPSWDEDTQRFEIKGNHESFIFADLLGEMIKLHGHLLEHYLQRKGL